MEAGVRNNPNQEDRELELFKLRHTVSQQWLQLGCQVSVPSDHIFGYLVLEFKQVSAHSSREYQYQSFPGWLIIREVYKLDTSLPMLYT